MANQSRLRSYGSRPFFLAIVIAVGGYLLLLDKEVFSADTVPPMTGPHQSISIPPLVTLSEDLTNSELLVSNGNESLPIVIKADQRKKKFGSGGVVQVSAKMEKRIASSLVYIDTPIGRAIGCFVDLKDHILMLKEAIVCTPKVLQQIEKEKQLFEQIVALERKRLLAIRQKMNLLPSGHEHEKFKLLYAEKKKELHNSLEKQEKQEASLRYCSDSQQNKINTIQIHSVDGEELKIQRIKIGERGALALIEVDRGRVQYSPLRPRTIPFKTGATVVGAGFSEHLELLLHEGSVLGSQLPDEEQHICTDVNLQGVQGGELLIDKYGNVAGFNNGLLKDAKGNGCAISIVNVYKDFRDELIPQIRAVKRKYLVGNGE